MRKLNFEDYKIFREEEPDADDRVFTDYGRIVFVNPNADVSGTLTAYAQYQPVDIDVTEINATTPFSDWDEEGNEAIVEKVLEFAMLRAKKPREAELHRERAKNILDEAWDNLQKEQYQYQTHRARGGMFKRLDILEGGLEDDLFNRDQF